MSFLRPEGLSWLIPAAVLLLLGGLLDRRWRGLGLKRFAGARTLAARPPSSGRFWLLGVSTLAVLLALAGPRWGERLVESPSYGIDLMVVLDVSRSMTVRDVEPDRLGRARRELLDLSERFGAGRLGLVSFGGSGDLLCPLTHDRDGFRAFVREADPLLTPVGGTSIGAGLERALAAFDRESPVTQVTQVILLLSDGENLQQDQRLDAASWTAYSRGVVIHSVLIGTRSGGKIPAGNGFVSDPQGREVTSVAHGDRLRAIARRTGGISLEAGAEPFPVARLVRERLSDLTPGVTGQALRAEPVDRAGWFLALALLLLTTPFLIESRRALRRTLRIASLLLVAPLIAGGSGGADSAREGVARYERGEFQAAQQSFERAFQEHPESAAIGFDLAVSSYALGQYERAARDFDRTLRLAAPPLLAKAAFGAGLARARMAARIVEQTGDQPDGLHAAVALLRRARGDFAEALGQGHGRQAAVDLELVARSLRDLEQKLAARNRDRNGSSDPEDPADQPNQPNQPNQSDQSDQSDQDGQAPDRDRGDRSSAERERSDAPREGGSTAPSDPPARLPGGLFREQAGNLEQIVRRYDRERRQYDRGRARRSRARTERDW